MDFTAKEIGLALLGSGGFIGGLISLFVFITARLDKRRERKANEIDLEMSKTSEMKKYELDSTNAVHQQLWEIIKEKAGVISSLEEDIEELEKHAVLTRPAITKIYNNLRLIRKEIESLNLMILSEEETNVFMRRFQNVKVLLDETEALIP